MLAFFTIHQERLTFNSASRVARDAAGWLLVAALFFAPWAYGATTAWAIRGLDGILAATLLVWLLGSLVRSGREPLSAPRFALLGLVGAVLFLGWWMAWNAHYVCDTDYFIFLPLKAPFPGVAGSVDYALSRAWMVRASLLLGTLLVARERAAEDRWLLRIWWAVGLAGTSIALLGLLQKATGATMIFWQAPIGPATKTFFATYYYHANAGAYLNLTLPPIAGLAYRYATRPANPAVRALWLTALVLVVVAVASNTSRMAQLVAGLMGLALLVCSSGRVLRRAREMEWKTVLIGLLVLSAATWAVIQASHLDQPLARWATTQETYQRDARWLVAQAAWQAVPAAGPLGFGPGTFSVVFPYFTNQLGTSAQGVWLYLHNDYLQTALEWGWLGSALLGGIFFGGILLALWHLAGGAEGWAPRRRSLLPLLVTALVGVALHALVDFPLQIASIELYVAVYLGICWAPAGGRRVKG